MIAITTGITTKAPGMIAADRMSIAAERVQDFRHRTNRTPGLSQRPGPLTPTRLQRFTPVAWA
jgi:hypothetical protein